jgi:sn-glycerol 3-phosphate transport system permease protein
MVERHPWLDAFTTLILGMGTLMLCIPIYYAIVMASQASEKEALSFFALPSRYLLENFIVALSRPDVRSQLVNSFIMALGITVGKISISFLSAFAVMYFRFPFRRTVFWLIFVTLMLPVEVRIVPTFEVVADLFAPVNALVDVLNIERLVSAVAGTDVSLRIDFSMLDSYGGLILPLIASATATFLFRQFFLIVPDELCEAAKIDGAGPLRFLFYILLPLSFTSIAALGVILFIYGWNQYLWPLLITTDSRMTTIVIGVARTLPTDNADTQWNITMATTLLATLPPIVVVLLLQRWFVKGLVEPEK